MRYEFSPDRTPVTLYREAGDPKLTDKRSGWAPVHPAAHRLMYLLQQAMQAAGGGKYSTKASTSTLKAKHRPTTATGDVPFLYVKNTLRDVQGFFVIHDDSVQANEVWLRDGQITFRIERESALAVRKLADKFAKEFVHAFAAGEVDAPSGGDCFFCSMFDRAGISGSGHVAGHVAEKYFVPSLLVNAVKASGNRWLSLSLGSQWQYQRKPSTGAATSLQRVLAHYVEAALVREGVQSAADLPQMDA